MGVFEHFPYANFHDLNLDWILGVVKGIPGDVKAAQDEMRPTLQLVNINPAEWKQDSNGYYTDINLLIYNVPTDATLNIGIGGAVAEVTYNAIANARITAGNYNNGVLRILAYGDVPTVIIPIGVMWWR